MALGVEASCSTSSITGIPPSTRQAHFLCVQAQDLGSESIFYLPVNVIRIYIDSDIKKHVITDYCLQHLWTTFYLLLKCFGFQNYLCLPPHIVTAL